MLSQLIWWSSIALEILLLIRGLQTRLAFRYPIFFSYVAFVLICEDFLSVVMRHWNRQVYAYTYWATEFVGVMIGCAVVFEIYREGLSHYPGTARMARNFLGLIFLLAIAKGLVAAVNDPRWWLVANTIEIERVLRTVQALAIGALVAVSLLYSIRFGRNLRGILFGYGLFVSVLAVCLSFVTLGQHNFWFYAGSASYLVALVAWNSHLWSYSRGAVVETAGSQLEIDYQRVAAATRRRLQAARGQLAKAVRS
jgi:hypothetical protein